MNITICDRCNAQLQIPLIDEINLRQHQQSKSCKAIAAKVKASASQPKITSLLRHVFASPAASDATAAAVQPVTPISSPSSTSAEEIVGVEVEVAYCQEAEGGILASEDGHANGASDLFVLEQVNARGMGITTTIYKRNAAMCSI